MIYTSYFANINNISNNVKSPTFISIANITPKWFHKYGVEYKKLAPTSSLLETYRGGHNDDTYRLGFDLILNKLCVKDVLKDLYGLQPVEIQIEEAKFKYPWYKNEYFNVFLLCYESPKKFCHRSMVSEWFNDNGIIVREY